ncbi:MAG: efflux RND transporter permease subunit [Bdellovibrionaceae bacterium]|nr:efflux RND transporter permease subunit [Pseudobdellovibrionaceae bacterium]
MNFIALSIRRPVFAWILMSAFIIFGSISLSQLGISQLPDVDFPVVNVSVTFDGASPEVIEAELLDPIEQRLLNIENIVSVNSNAQEGNGRVTIDFDINKNVDIALQEVQSALSQLRLPPGVDFPVIRKVNPEEQPIMFLGMWSNGSIYDTIKYADLIFLDKLRQIPGIGEVSIGGFSERNIRVWPDMKKLKARDLSLLDLAQALNTQHVETSAGRFENPKTEYRLRWMGEASTVEEVKKIKVLSRGSQVIQDRVFTIGDVARVEDSLSDIRRKSRIEGQEAISIMIRKQRGGNEVALSDAVKKKIDELRPTLPEGYQIRTNIDFTRPTEAVVKTTFEKLFTAALVTILICFLFLGSIQSSVNILFSIPTSIFGSFIIIYLCGFTLNLFTLLALILAISIVVDDAIMLLENIVRHHRMGKTGAQAAYDGAMEILPAASAATFAVVAVFLPVIFMTGITGKFFFQFGIALSGAVLLSLIEAVTITPMRSAALLDLSQKTSRFEQFLDDKFHALGNFYKKIIHYAIKFPFLTVLASTILFVASLSLSGLIHKEFVPAQDQDFIMINIETPPGSSLDLTEKKSFEVEEVIKNNPFVESYVFMVGANWSSSNVNTMTVPLFLISRKERSVGHLQIMNDLRKEFSKIEGIRFTLRDNSSRNMTTGRQFPVSFNLSGPDLNVLNEKAAEIIAELEKRGVAQSLNTDFKMGLPEVKILPDRVKMISMGVSVQNVAQTLSIALAGVRQNRFTADGRRIDIRIKIPENEMVSKENIENIQVRNVFGNLVPIKSFVELIDEPSYQSIIRVNRQRAIGVFGGLASDVSQADALSTTETVAKELLPDGYGIALEGASAGLAEAFKSLTSALIIGILVAYMILAIQFNSFLHPISVLVALPFSLTGAFIALWMFNTSLNLFSFIGIIVLMGIAKKNSILLVEFTNQLREQGMEIRQALMDAGATRLRPILMTSFATVFAALPLVFGNTMGQETRTPMGLVIIGGTVVSTVFTLVVVPCLYLLLSKLERSHKKVTINT